MVPSGYTTGHDAVDPRLARLATRWDVVLLTVTGRLRGQVANRSAQVLRPVAEDGEH